MKVYIIILNYNNAEDTLKCIDSIKCIRHRHYHIVVVDNNSSPKCIQQLEQNLGEDVTLIKNSDNNGYAAGNNVGIKYALQNSANYIVILNNDVIVNETSFEPCLKLLKENDDVAIAGPAIVDYSSGKLQSTGSMINFNKLTTPLINYDKEYIPSSALVDCDYVGGACLVFKSSLIDKIGLMPENYFLFWEEVEWCYKAKKQGLRVLCNLESFVLHKGSATINKISGLSTYFMERNKIIFAKRNISNPLCLVVSIIFLFLRNIYKMIRYDRKYFKYFSYYIDGLLERTNKGIFIE
ncbi:MAG: glycosyltransferase family 2 protein [Lachnospiraceae bacterium]|nr:glycosyltransferase family 2 protein [Lachnospiraceae bacterium]